MTALYLLVSENMASDINFVTYILDQLEGIENITSKKMFGEYDIYFNKKIVALICDNRLLVKITNVGREYIEDVKEDFPYPGAKPCFLIEDNLEDKEWLCELIQLTEKELPEPKSKKRTNAIKINFSRCKARYDPVFEPIALRP
jgi:TfoX/Sxy family transcriptional regulator of competence genes